jgi:serine/threonine protein kinase
VMLDDARRGYLADFGLAKDRQASTVLTRLGQAVGSVYYMPPEQVRSEQVDARADVYGLGCLVWECLCGLPPFADRAGTMQVMWAQLRESPGDLRAYRPDATSELGWAVAKALEKDPGDRPPTTTAYARMLQVATA